MKITQYFKNADPFEKVMFLFTALIVLIIIFLSTYNVIAPYALKDNVTFVVTGKERINKRESSKYLIFTEKEDGSREVFENEDNFFIWKFNSSDLYGIIQEDKKYNADVYGLRIRFFSMYRNIADIKEVKEVK